jgi:hypothetical protein
MLRGRDEVRVWLERFLEAWEELDIELVDLIETGEGTREALEAVGSQAGDAESRRGGTR